MRHQDYASVNHFGGNSEVGIILEVMDEMMNRINL
jgi:hypothetical protein